MKIGFWRVFFTVFISIASLFFSLGNIFDFRFVKKIPLGLDLQGGNELLLQVNFKNYLEDKYLIALDDIKLKAISKQLSVANCYASSDGILLIFKNSDNNINIQNALDAILSDLQRVFVTKFAQEENTCLISYNKKYLEEMQKQVVDQSMKIIRHRLDSSGINEISLHKQSNDQILIQIPGTKNQNELKDLLSKVAQLSFHMVDETISTEEFDKNLYKNSKLVFNLNDPKFSIIVKKHVLFTGENVKFAKLDSDEYSMPFVAFSLDALGTKIFAQITSENIGKRIAILLDNKLLTAPVINQPILSGQGIISSSNFSFKEASQLANFISSGSLPAQIEILEERIIGPSLGADYILKGQYAITIALIIVILIMIMFYSVLGVTAAISLLFTINYIIGLFTLIGVTLTFAAIAGIALTIGMAVDANVLVYEKIKEEIRSKNSDPYSVFLGFKSAFVSIWDSNITTLFAMFFLYILGTGPLQSFSIALSVGIISSMFSALVVNRIFVTLIVSYVPKSYFKFVRLI